MDDLTEEAREPLDDARKLLSVPVEEWTRESAEIAEGIVAAYVDNVPALLARLEAAEADKKRQDRRIVHLEDDNKQLAALVAPALRRAQEAEAKLARVAKAWPLVRETDWEVVAAIKEIDAALQGEG